MARNWWHLQAASISEASKHQRVAKENRKHRRRQRDGIIGGIIIKMHDVAAA